MGKNNSSLLVKIICVLGLLELTSILLWAIFPDYKGVSPIVKKWKQAPFFLAFIGCLIYGYIKAWKMQKKGVIVVLIFNILIVILSMIILPMSYDNWAYFGEDSYVRIGAALTYLAWHIFVSIYLIKKMKTFSTDVIRS